MGANYEETSLTDADRKEFAASSVMQKQVEMERLATLWSTERDAKRVERDATFTRGSGSRVESMLRVPHLGLLAHPIPRCPLTLFCDMFGNDCPSIPLSKFVGPSSKLELYERS